MKKILVVGIILLFIGVAIAPSINQSVVTASPEADLVEVTTQACGIQGYGNTTVKLTREQYQNLEEYLVGFRARLNQTSTREEAVPIFKDAVVELDKYGLLPKGMSVEKTQHLITNRYQNLKKGMLLDKVPANVLEKSYDIKNLFCIIAGRATFCWVANLIISGLRCVLSILCNGISTPIVMFLWLLTTWSYLLKNYPSARIINFFNLLSLLTFGQEGNYGYDAFPSIGWVFTAGLLGIKTCNGSLYGKIHFPVINILATQYTGAFGFTGIKIILPDYSSQFLGTALRVNIDDSPPS